MEYRQARMGVSEWGWATPVPVSRGVAADLEGFDRSLSAERSVHSLESPGTPHAPAPLMRGAVPEQELLDSGGKLRPFGRLPAVGEADGEPTRGDTGTLAAIDFPCSS